MARHQGFGGRLLGLVVGVGLAVGAGPPAVADSFPRLVPLETILPPPFVPDADDPSGAGAGAGTDAAALDGRVAGLRARAAALRDRPVIDAGMRRRVEAARAR
ncbi:MAG: hypothetical protein ACXIU8_04290 [Alkalilacustris sp.]